MKKLLLLPALLLPLTLFAKIWIVDSNPGSASKDFVNLQEAHDGASAGDTLYLIGSSVSYITTKVTINKRLIIIGPGYLLINPETQVSLATAFFRLTGEQCTVGIEFAGGSEGSAMIGVTHFQWLVISTSNIMIKRNHFAYNGQMCIGHNILTVSGSAISIVQNCFEGSGFRTILVNSGNNNIRINNNLFSTGTVYPVEALGSSSEFVNNIFHGHLRIDNALVQNNISVLNGTSHGLNNCIVRNNISTINNWPADNNNILNIPQANIFVNTGTIDARWKLKDGSPAIGSGYNGTDMGIFGGAEPYVLSGIPPIPTIYGLEAPLTGEKNTGLPIEIKAKSNN